MSIENIKFWLIVKVTEGKCPVKGIYWVELYFYTFQFLVGTDIQSVTYIMLIYKYYFKT